VPAAPHWVCKPGFAVKPLIVLLVLLAGLSGTVAMTAEPDDAAAREAARTLLEGPAYPFIEAARWTSARLFIVGVHYMGSAENALAREICGVLTAQGVGTGTRVRVLDINTMGPDPERWEVIGEARC